MSTHAEIAPEDCPQPFWHSTHYYCPVCTWTAPDAPKSKETQLAEDRALLIVAVRDLHRFIVDELDSEPLPNADDYLGWSAERRGQLRAMLREVSGE